MNRKYSALALAASAALGLSACGGGDSSSDDGGGDSTSSLQQDAVANGQVKFQAGSDLSTFSIDNNTFAVDTGSTTPGGSPPSGIDSNSYFGAVDPSASSPVWWENWTVHGSSADGSLKSKDIHPLSDNIDSDSTDDGPNDIEPAGSANCNGVDSDLSALSSKTTVFSDDFPVCVIQRGDLDNGDGATVTLPNDHVFVLDGFVSVGNGETDDTSPSNANTVTVEIESGTQIVGATDTDGSLIITRGSRLNVNGELGQPVVMSGVEVTRSSGTIDGFQNNTPLENVTERGTFGGVVVDGFAQTNAAASDGEATSEVVQSGQTRYYGGNKDSDNSGSIDYLVIAESGVTFAPDEEIQGLTLEGVGSNTTVSHVQVIGSEDDGIEVFGGKPAIDHVVINGQDDDGLDLDLGYRGSLQYAIVRMGGSKGNRGIESDNNGGNFQKKPESAPNLGYITILGNTGGDDDTTAALHREGFQGKAYGVAYADDSVAGTAFENGCLDVDDTLESALSYDGSVFKCSPDNVAPADD